MELPSSVVEGTAGLVISVVLWLVLRPLLVLGLSPRASLRATNGPWTMRFPPEVEGRVWIATRVGIVVSVGVAMLGHVALAVGLGVFVALAFASRYGATSSTISFDQLQLRSQGAWGKPVTIPWAFLTSVKAEGLIPALVFVGSDKQVIRVPEGMMGLGALALHVDDLAPATGFNIEETARARLLQAYRSGLVEAQEDPNAWLAQRSGPISRKP